ncbi:hypothetical protein RUE5091_00284 [Ruegeria denitrificans]|uniref:Uncharacterized protein n=1 Tax=Ruegeria denitrificans TaxID=1715692 RepID=A0A0P1IDK6_9RHOB|nr:hypothetical protein [Ruegeria denitrificans]CUJ85002.1 hypothetical protein RUE5091_00284 [Ruegeria denitrificans]
MATAYFLTSTILIVWAYFQTRATARNIRIARGSRPCPLTNAGAAQILPQNVNRSVSMSAAHEKPAAGATTGD